MTDVTDERRSAEAGANSYLLETRLDIAELEAQHGGPLELDEFEDLLRQLGAIARGHQWWLGDALVYGENRYGPDLYQIAEATGLEPHTLVNYRWVADAVNASRRRDELTWSHHAEVARLAAATQRELLARAVKESWTVRQLRDHVALNYPQSTGPEFEPLPGMSGGEETDANRAIERVERVLDETDVLAEVDPTGAFVTDLRVVVALAKKAVGR